jgi:hypothetical protein
MEAYIREKEKKVHSMLDTIVQNKESSAKSKDIVERDQVLQEELAKIVSLSDEHILVERFLGTMNCEPQEGCSDIQMTGSTK